MSDGPFYFAWCDEGDSFGVEHLVEDLKIFEFAFGQNENERATLVLTVANPRVGLLNEDRQQWCLFAWDDGSTAGAQPLFHGRIIGMPTDMSGPLVKITFEARPTDFNDQKLALAETLKVFPYWDPLWIRPEDRDNPDVVLQARTALYHVDPIALTVTISDIISGEDGMLSYGGGDVLANSVRPTIAAPAISRVQMRADVRFTQKAVGQVDISAQVANAAAISGSTQAGMITTYTPDSFVDAWPLPGDNIGAGWKWIDANIINGENQWVSPELTADQTYTVYGSVFSTSDPSFTLDGTLFGQTLAADFTLGILKPTLVAGYDVQRGYTEHVSFDLTADVQDVVTDPAGADVKTITLASNDASEPIDDGEVPLGDLRQRSYMLTDRGHRSFEYLLARARAELLDGARAVSLEFALPFGEVFNLSTRKNATIDDPDLPGGTASGKIVGFSATGSGSSGAFRCTVSLGVCVGKGSTASAELGDPVYAAAGYMQTGYQVYEERHILVAGDVTYQDYSGIRPNDDGLNFFDNSVANWLTSIIVTNTATAQISALQSAGTSITDLSGGASGGLGGNVLFHSIEDVANTLASYTTKLCIDFKDATGGPFETDFPVTVGQVVVPQGIDLTAGA